MSPDSLEYLEPETLGGLNLYSYCNNNPVMYADPSGKVLISISALIMGIIVGAVVGAIIGAGYGAITAAATGQNIWAGALIGGLAGLFMGAAAGAGGVLFGAVFSSTATIVGATFEISKNLAIALGVIIPFIGGAVFGAGAEIMSQFINSGRVTDGLSVALSALQWGIMNTLSGLGGSVVNGLAGVIAVDIVYTAVFGGYGVIFDVFRNYLGKKDGQNSNKYRRSMRYGR